MSHNLNHTSTVAMLENIKNVEASLDAVTGATVAVELRMRFIMSGLAPQIGVDKDQRVMLGSASSLFINHCYQ